MVRVPWAALRIDRDVTLGTKDRSWGIRPLAGGDRRGAPALPQAGGLFSVGTVAF